MKSDVPWKGDVVSIYVPRFLVQEITVLQQREPPCTPCSAIQTIMTLELLLCAGSCPRCQQAYKVPCGSFFLGVSEAPGSQNLSSWTLEGLVKGSPYLRSWERSGLENVWAWPGLWLPIGKCSWMWKVAAARLRGDKKGGVNWHLYLCVTEWLE